MTSCEQGVPGPHQTRVERTEAEAGKLRGVCRRCGNVQEYAVNAPGTWPLKRKKDERIGR